MTKAVDAFRTISEVAEDLDIPKHVLRFWEVKFPQIKPMKRGGGRRYYRPEDVVLLNGIRNLLHAEGYTIKGVQKILREQGVEEVKAYAPVAVKGSTKGTGSKKGAGVLGGGADVRTATERGRVRELPRGKAARDGRKRKGSVAAIDVAAVLDGAIFELQACRTALVAAGSVTGGPHVGSQAGTVQSASRQASRLR